MKKYNKILSEIENNIPDIKDSIYNKINWQQLKNNAVTKKPKSQKWRYAFATAATAILLFFSIATPLIVNKDKNFVAGSYTLTISINPSIELKANENDIVISQQGLNQEGVLLLYKENLIGKNINEAVDKVIELSDVMGYLNNVSNVKVIVKNADGRIVLNKQNKVCSSIENYLVKNNKSKLNVESLEEQDLSELVSNYNKNDMQAYEQLVGEVFNQKLIELSNQKLNDCEALINYLTPYAGTSGAKIHDFNNGIVKILEFVSKYNYSLPNNYFVYVSYYDVENLCHDLNILKASITKAIQKLQSGENEQEYSGSIIELYERVKEEIKQ